MREVKSQKKPRSVKNSDEFDLIFRNENIRISLSKSRVFLKVVWYSDGKKTVKYRCRRLDDQNEIGRLEDSKPQWITYCSPKYTYIIRRQTDHGYLKDYFKVIEGGKAEIKRNGFFKPIIIQAKDCDWIYYKKDRGRTV